MSKRFRTRMVMNIFYSAVIACLIEIFLVANVSMITGYLRETRYADSFFLQLLELDTLMMLVYVISGILIFSVTFLALQEKAMRYISRLSAAVQNISEGDLNTTVEVIGDDEFSAMAANLNKMVGDIRNLICLDPFSFFRNRSRTMVWTLCDGAHSLYFMRIIHIGNSFQIMDFKK